MPAISSLIAKLAASYPEITFSTGEYAYWSTSQKTVFYCPHEPHAAWVILHETAHSLLDHQDYSRDIELLRLEQEAWSYATTLLAPRFGITIDPEFIETQLDTYRDWLHSKSTCPACQSNGLEQAKHHYTCLHCQTSWHTNTGIDVEIRRFITT